MDQHNSYSLFVDIQETRLLSRSGVLAVHSQSLYVLNWGREGYFFVSAKVGHATFPHVTSHFPSRDVILSLT